MNSENTVINQELVIWCFVVVAELIILAWLINSGLVLLIGLVLIGPFKAAFNWPMNKKIENKNSENTEKAE